VPEPEVAPTSHPAAGVGRSVAVLAVVGLGLAAVLAMVLARQVGGSVPPAEVPVGASEEGWTAFEYNDDGTPVRWDACEPIDVVVSTVGAPAPVEPDAFLADVEDALVDLRATSGLDLRVIGTSDEQPSSDRSTLSVDTDGSPRWAPVLVGWRAPGATELPLRDTDRGIAMPVATGSPGARQYVTGQVVLNRDRDDLVTGREDRSTSWGATVLHELAHILGLDHVEDADELLSIHPGDGPVTLGPGDRAGLAALGAGGGCLGTPAPTELDLEVPAR
jgi:hypothetical protein